MRDAWDRAGPEGVPSDAPPSPASEVPRTWLGRMWAYGARQSAVIWRKRKWPYDVRQFDPRVDFFGPRLGFHYIYHPEERLAHRETDERGFSIVHIGGRRRRQPTTHCHVAMHLFHRYLESHDEGLKAQFLHKADLLLEARERVTLGGTACDAWFFRFEVPSYAPHPVPWIGCLAQSWAISVLCRAHQVTGRQDFLDAAVGSMATYTVPVADGGLRWTDPAGRAYYEKHPYPGKLRHVLNGFMSSLMGLYDLYRATGSEEAKRLFDDGVATLACEDVLDRYDRGYISAYDQAPTRGALPSWPRYHFLHIRQLLVLHRLTGLEVFRARAERWYAYTRDPVCRLRWMLESAAFRARNIPRYIRQTIRAP